MRPGELESLLQLAPADRLEPLTEIARSVLADGGVLTLQPLSSDNQRTAFPGLR